MYFRLLRWISTERSLAEQSTFWNNDNMGQRTIAIGDIHGCSEAFRAIVAAIEPTTDDTLIILGDCIDRGPNSQVVIQELFKLREKCKLVPILGNHEEMMLCYLDNRHLPDNWLECGGSETLASYQASEDLTAIPSKHVDFIRTWGDYWENESHFFVHGGYDADTPLFSQRWNVYRWQSLRMHVPTVHGSGKTAVVGHTSQKNGKVLDLGYLKCIDTYCYGGGWLTALDTNSGQVWQANCEGHLRENTA